MAMAELREGDPASLATIVQEVSIRFSSLELERLRDLAAREGATVADYIRACVLGPRAPGPVEILAEIMQRRLGGGWPRE
jgi:hypothetical protein